MQKLAKWLLIAVGTLSWSVTMIKSGWLYAYGLGFWGANGHDGIWHLAVIQGLMRGSLNMPVFSGESIKNYHLGFDFLVAILARLTSVSASTWYFQIIPPLLALGIGYFVYVWVANWKGTVAAWWSVFFVYFGGSWAWVLNRGESTFWSQQAISTLINPPFALSILLIAVIFTLWPNVKKVASWQFWLVVVLFAVLPSIKVYAGILGFLGLMVVSIRHKLARILGLVSAALAFVLFWPINRHASGLLVFYPGWFLETLVNLTDRMYLPRIYYWMKSDLLAKKIGGYCVALAMFVVGNLGSRLVLIFSKPKWDDNYLFMSTGMLVGLIFPMLFLQSGTPWNTIQFFYYSLFFAAILAGVAVGEFVAKKAQYFKYVIYVLVILFTIPTTWKSLPNYLPDRPPAEVSKSELEAITFLKNQKDGVVLTPVYDDNAAKAAESNPPRPLYLYTSTAYVSALANKPVYLEDEVNLDITGFDWRTRRKLSEQFFAETNIPTAKKFLEENKINYIYLPDVAQTRPKLSETQLGMKKLFENSKAAIWGKID